jgi:hypothetical protein
MRHVNFFILFIFSFIPKVISAKPGIIDERHGIKTFAMISLITLFYFHTHFRDYSSAWGHWGYPMHEQNEEMKMVFRRVYLHLTKCSPLLQSN